MKWYQIPLWLTGLFLQVLVLTTLLKGPFRRFPLVFAYLISLTLTTIVEITAGTEQGTISAAWRSYYWIGELVRQTLLFAVVVSLFQYAMPKGPRRAAFVRLLVLLAILYWACTFYLGYDQRTGVWMTGAIRNISFGSMILNLLLWGLLLTRRPRQIVPLMVSGGYGIQMAGEAIGQSLRQLWPFFGSPGSGGARAWVDFSNLLIVLTHFAGLYVWWRAFRRPEASAPEAVGLE